MLCFAVLIGLFGLIALLGLFLMGIVYLSFLLACLLSIRSYQFFF